MKSSGFRDWLSVLCYFTRGRVPTQKALAEATNTLAGRALFSNPEAEVYVRLGTREGAIYLDLANESWEAIRITSVGWEIVATAPVKFLRPPGMLSLPHPVRGGSIDNLRPFLNLDDDDHWKMAVSWLLAALSPKGPYPIVVIEGFQGSAKSTVSRLLLSLISPSVAPLRSPPKNPHDLAISAKNSWCLGFDNLSSIQPWLSDALCRLSTGGGFATRALYTNEEEKIFQDMRPVLLNGIDIGIDRADLLDRSIVLSLPAIPEESRQPEARLREHFKCRQPYILGALLDAVACALRRLPEISLAKLPRMADFAKWIYAAEPALGWPPGSFLKAYLQNREDGNRVALEASPLVPLITSLVTRGPWRGTPTDLYGQLHAEQLNLPIHEVQAFPRTPKDLSQALKRLAPNLRQIGIVVEFGRTAGSSSQRTITITDNRETAQGAGESIG